MRFDISQIVALKELAQAVERDARNDTWRMTKIIELCQLTLQFCASFDAVPREPKSVMYDAVRRLYPNSFGRHDVAAHFVELLQERYTESGATKEK